MADNGLTNDHASNDNLMVLMDEELDQDDEFDLEYYLAAADQAPLTSETMAAVVSDDGPTAADELAALSNLPTALRSEFAARWARLALARRRELINSLGRLEDVEVVYTFGPIFYVALDDPDPPFGGRRFRASATTHPKRCLKSYCPSRGNPIPRCSPPQSKRSQAMLTSLPSARSTAPQPRGSPRRCTGWFNTSRLAAGFNFERSSRLPTYPTTPSRTSTLSGFTTRAAKRNRSPH
ncbi:MAG: hypothetical protein WKH64_05295 [Chloroflexia bacterium]